jgi:1-acyl-sn-glycerol-3-phosphate acyltransferase
VLLTPFFLCTIFFWTLLMMLAGLPLSLVSPDWLHNWGRLWARGGLLLAGVRLEIHGTEHTPAGRPLVFMPNHQSSFDILVMYAAIPGQFRWLAKAELFRIPIFGLTMSRAGYISIDRSNRIKALESMKLAAGRIAAGTSVVIFPEGTRTTDGHLLPFKKGGFMLALQSGVDIVPMAIQGSYEVMSKKSLKVRSGTIRVDFFPPVTTSTHSVRELDDLMNQVREPIAAGLAAGRAS